MKKYIIVIVVIAIIILILFGSYYIYSSNHSQNDIDNLKSKADEEISYLSTTIISMLNKLNNITYTHYEIVEENISQEQSNTQGGSLSSDNQNQEKGNNSEGQQGDKGTTQGQGQSNSITNMSMKESSILVNSNKKIDWDNIKKETEKMYQTWTTVLIDLNTLNTNKDNLKRYSTTLDSVTKAVQKEDKKATATELANLYSLLASYTKDYSNDTKKINLLNTKSNILFSYALAEDDKWQDMKSSIKKAQNAYNNILNGGIQNNGNISSINKAYILLNEIEKSTDTKDKNIYYINYKNLMKELEVLGD